MLGIWENMLLLEFLWIHTLESSFTLSLWIRINQHGNNSPFALKLISIESKRSVNVPLALQNQKCN